MTNHTILAITVTSLLAVSSTSVTAKTLVETEQQREQRQTESLTTGTGMIIGGILGGPLGAFATGMLAGLFTKTYHDKQNLAKAENLMQQQDQTIARYQQQLQQADQNYQQELIALQHSYQQAGQLQLQNLLLSLQFKTGQSDIPAYYQSQLDALAQLLKQAPQLVVQLSGYTDLQGNAQFNQQLSEQRVNAVKQALIARGIDSEQLTTYAYGATAPVEATKEQPVSFYDRRVMIQLKPANNALVDNRY